jgi:hypothetical protein
VPVQKEEFMPAATKTSAKEGTVEGHVFSPVVISINTGTPLTGPTVDKPVVVVNSHQQIRWVAPPGEYWVVKVEPNNSIFDANRGYVFHPGNDTTASVEFTTADIIKYSVATTSGVIDPHILPMP